MYMIYTHIYTLHAFNHKQFEDLIKITKAEMQQEWKQQHAQVEKIQ